MGQFSSMLRGVLAADVSGSWGRGVPLKGACNSSLFNAVTCGHCVVSLYMDMGLYSDLSTVAVIHVGAAHSKRGRGIRF